LLVIESSSLQARDGHTVGVHVYGALINIDPADVRIAAFTIATTAAGAAPDTREGEGDCCDDRQATEYDPPDCMNLARPSLYSVPALVGQRDGPFSFCG
jgi:hypothetical protein